jgi:sugar lactone lactonase YvrE
MRMGAAGVSAGGGDVWTNPDLANASYDSVSFSVGSQESNPQSVFFKPNGLKMYVIGTVGDDINEYDLSTPWDFSTLSFLQSASVASEETTPHGLFIRSDGERAYIVGSASDEVNEYSLSTPWDISTISLNYSLSVSDEETGPQDVWFSSDGEKMFVLGYTGGDINEYHLSTAWSISTSSFSQSFSISSEETDPRGLAISPDGTRIFLVGNGSDNVHQYNLTTGYDLSTASYAEISFSVASQETVPLGIKFKFDGSKMYVIGTSADTIYQYSTVTPAGPAAWTNPDLANASYDSVSFSVSGQENNPQGIFFKPDGSKMYVIGLIGDDVNEYDLSTAWDITSASYLQNFSVAAQELAPRDVFFKPDGSKMYVIGSAGDDVNEYDLSTAWDITSASYLQNFSVSARETFPTGFFFKPDGTKMYIIGSAGDDVNEYDLSTAWDITSASYLQNFSVSAQETVPQGIFFSPDGTKMYIIGSAGDDVNEYDLSTAWDVSTASYLQNFSVSAQETFPTGIFFKPDGSKMYVLGSVSGVAIYQYSTA